jgi:hypothetical protein
MGAVALGACADAQLSSVAGELRLEPGGDLAIRAFIGHRSELRLRLENASRAGRAYRIRVDPPFELRGVTEGTLAGGESRELAVRLTPEAPGNLFGALLLESSPNPVRGADGIAPGACGKGSTARPRHERQAHAPGVVQSTG